MPPPPQKCEGDQPSSVGLSGVMEGRAQYELAEWRLLGIAHALALGHGGGFFFCFFFFKHTGEKGRSKASPAGLADVISEGSARWIR